MRCVTRRQWRKQFCVGEFSSKSGSYAERHDPIVLTPYDQRRGIYRSIGRYYFLNMRWDDKLSCFDQRRFRAKFFKRGCILRDSFLCDLGLVVLDAAKHDCNLYLF